MIFTSSYDVWHPCEKYRVFSISGDRGKDANYAGECYLDLAPKKLFWMIWRDNIGKIPEEANNRFYVKEYWNAVLSKLDPRKVYDELNYSVLLCYEPNNLFCHRHIVASWFELTLGAVIPEVRTDRQGKLEIVSRPAYIKGYLEDVMVSY